MLEETAPQLDSARLLQRSVDRRRVNLCAVDAPDKFHDQLWRCRTTVLFELVKIVLNVAPDALCGIGPKEVPPAIVPYGDSRAVTQVYELTVANVYATLSAVPPSSMVPPIWTQARMSWCGVTSPPKEEPLQGPCLWDD